MDRHTQNIMQHFAQEIKRIFDNDLKSIIIYGSYARGDNNKQSDVDVMILVSLQEEKIRAKMNKVSDCAFDFLMQYGIDISPIVKNIEHFNYWVDNVPFYRNVRDESDYDDFYIASYEDAKAQFETVELIISMVKKHLAGKMIFD